MMKEETLLPSFVLNENELCENFCTQVNITDTARVAESMAFAQQAEMNYVA